MVILFNTWDNRIFHSFRPQNLTPIPQHIGLNNANPLTGGFMALGDLSHPEDAAKHEEYVMRCRLMGKRLSAANMSKILKNAREGGPVTVTCRPTARLECSNMGSKHSSKRYLFPPILRRTWIMTLLRKVNVIYDISDVQPHHTPYACKAKYEDPTRLLGIKLRRKYSGGPMRNIEF